MIASGPASGPPKSAPKDPPRNKAAGSPKPTVPAKHWKSPVGLRPDDQSPLHPRWARRQELRALRTDGAGKNGQPNGTRPKMLRATRPTFPARSM